MKPVDSAGTLDSMNEFLANGRLGPIEIGMSMQKVEKHLGPPDDISVGLRRWKVLSYGPHRCLQISHYDAIVRMIGVHFLPGEPAVPELPAVSRVSIPFSGQTKVDAFKRYLGDHGIGWTDGPDMPGSSSLKVGKNVVATFEEDGMVYSLIARE